MYPYLETFIPLPFLVIPNDDKTGQHLQQEERHDQNERDHKHDGHYSRVGRIVENALQEGEPVVCGTDNEERHHGFVGVVEGKWSACPVG